MHRMNAEGKLVTITLSGEVRSEDYQEMVPELEAHINTFGPLRLLLVLEHMEGFEPGALLRDLRFDTKHLNDFERVAVVGDERWQEWGTKLGGSLTEAEVRFFEPTHRAEARQWVQDGSEGSV